MGYISPEPMYPDKGDISAAVDADTSRSKDSTATTGEPGTAPLLKLRNGALQAGLHERLRVVVARRQVRFGLD